MAVASARATHAANGAAPTAVFEVAEGLENVDDDSVDVIVNNPPFHEDQAVGDEVAWSMFTQSRAALRAGGELRVVGNRHLGYHTKLKRIFGNCETVASNPKFVVLAARR
jgi:16S rRNA (guanine1207-N2)-methyltransferase